MCLWFASSIRVHRACCLSLLKRDFALSCFTALRAISGHEKISETILLLTKFWWLTFVNSDVFSTISNFQLAHHWLHIIILHHHKSRSLASLTVVGVFWGHITLFFFRSVTRAGARPGRSEIRVTSQRGPLNRVTVPSPWSLADAVPVTSSYDSELLEKWFPVLPSEQAEASEPPSQAGAAVVPLSWHCRGPVATGAIGSDSQIIIMMMTCTWTLCPESAAWPTSCKGFIRVCSEIPEYSRGVWILFR